MSSTTKPFRVSVPKAELDDLKARLARVRWPNEPIANETWDWGTNLSYMKRLVDYWRDTFDWRKAEAELNQFPQYTAEIELDGATHIVHFVHEKGSGTKALPLILTHGWPSTYREFLDVVEPLAHPERFGGNAEDGFDVIVPSLVGFGWSSKPATPIGPAAMAEVWHKLMHNVLGYDRYAAQAGDWGSFVTSRLALQHPANVVAIHLTMLPMRPDLKHPSQPKLTAEEIAWIEKMKTWWHQEEGYRSIQSTKPMALAYALMDSPVGLAGWLADKYWRLGDTRKDHAYSGMESRFPMHTMCTQLSLYWFSGTINSANMLYKVGPAERSALLKPGERVSVPTAYSDYPMDVLPPTPESWGRRGYNIVRWREMRAGGHFAAMEEPKIFAEDVQEFFKKYR